MNSDEIELLSDSKYRQFISAVDKALMGITDPRSRDKVHQCTTSIGEMLNTIQCKVTGSPLLDERLHGMLRKVIFDLYNTINFISTRI